MPRFLRASGLLLLCTSLACRQPVADLVLFGGNVITLAEPANAEAVAIRDGRFVLVGSSDDVLASARPGTKRIDLEGRTVVPGLADNHFHALGGGPGVDLSSARSVDDVIRAVAERARATPVGSVVVTNSNWHEGQLREHRLPLRDDLDRATRRHPVVVVRGGHEYVLNSAALEHWNIDEETTDFPGGRIGRYPDGRLNGELVDRAKRLAPLPSRPRPDREAMIERLREEHRRLNEVGLTSIRYAAGNMGQYELLVEMKDRGLLTVRVTYLLRFPARAPDVDSVLDTWGVQQGDGDDWLRIGGIKLGVDGGFEGGWMRDPYDEPHGDDGTYFGLQTFPTEPFKQLVAALNERGWRVATHAVGDAAIDLVLDAYEEAHSERSIRGQRWVIEHGFMPREDHFPRMRELGLLVSAQHHLYVAAPSLVEYWGRERAEWTTPIKAYRRAGIPVSAGTDSPVIPYNPFSVLYHFITRETISAGAMGVDQRLDRLDALRLSTADYAFLTFAEGRTGTIETGKLADLVVLNHDLLGVPDDMVRDLGPVMTIVDGTVVYDARN